MDSETSFSKVFLYQSHTEAFTYTLVIVMAILVIFYVFLQKSAPPKKTIYQAIQSNQTKVDIAVIYICLHQDLQLENLGLFINEGLSRPSRFFNVPINPTIVEASLDGTMAKKITIDGKNLYKITLPMEVPVERLILDMNADGPHSIFIFMENMKGKRVWEKNVNTGIGRYHTIDINSITFL